MSNDIRDIIERLAILEGRITPTTVKSGLNPQQKSVPQLPALFKPKHISVLTNKTDPEHPMHDYMVGDSVENEEEALEESQMSEIDQLMQDIGSGEVDIYDIYAHPKTPEEEYASKIVNRMYDDVSIDRGLHPDDDVENILDIVADQIAHDYPVDSVNESVANEDKLLDKVRKSLKDYLTSVADQYKDDNISKKAKDRDLGKKDKKDRDLVAKELDEDPTEEDPVTQAGTAPTVNPTYAESACIKSVMLENGAVFEIHGNEHTGFEIRHGNNRMKSRFKNIDEATMAIEMFRARQRKQDESQDYVEEK